MSVWAAGIGAAVAVAGTTMGAVKSSQASSQGAMASTFDAGMRSLEEQEGLVDAMFASIEQGGEALAQAGRESIAFILRALAMPL